MAKLKVTLEIEVEASPALSELVVRDDFTFENKALKIALSNLIKDVKISEVEITDKGDYPNRLPKSLRTKKPPIPQFPEDRVEKGVSSDKIK